MSHENQELDNWHEVKNGWIVAKYFLCKSRSINMPKNGEANIQPSWSDKLR